MSDRQDNIKVISLHEAHGRCNAVVELIAVEPLVLHNDQNSPDGYILLLDAKHHRAEKGKIRLGLTAERQPLIEMARRILIATDDEQA